MDDTADLERTQLVEQLVEEWLNGGFLTGKLGEAASRLGITGGELVLELRRRFHGSEEAAEANMAAREAEQRLKHDDGLFAQQRARLMRQKAAARKAEARRSA